MLLFYTVIIAVGAGMITYLLFKCYQKLEEISIKISKIIKRMN